MVLDKVNSPADVKKLTAEELTSLADEMRQLIIKKVNATGGHMGPNLGIIELTIALHRVFNSPRDKMVFDVSHQCYAHKILTGRKTGFTDPHSYLLYTGYTAPEESAHDPFKVGHTSTSISLATGLAKARDLQGEKGNVIALIGDGSLSGGEAFEGLNNAATLGSNLIIIVNDNEMSIAPNQGGLYNNLQALRTSRGQAENNFFKTFGFDYLYVENGNDIQTLTAALEQVKDFPRPVVVHVHTLKGRGLKVAEENKEAFHYIMPGALDEKPAAAPAETYASLTAEFLLERAATDKTLVAITPATPGATAFSQQFRDKMGKQFVDVGIAEEHAVAYASALAKGGARPVLSVLSSFIQRAYDQLSQDLCLNNTPATLLVNWGGITSGDATHLQVFDIPLISNIPNMVYLAPASKEEYFAMLRYALTQRKHPLAIRVPADPVLSTGIPDTIDYSQLNKYQLVEKGSRVAIIGLGSFFPLAQQVKKAIRQALAIDASLINPHFITGIDTALLDGLKKEHSVFITLEDGVLDGGFGEKIARYLGTSAVKVLCYGAKKEFTDRVPVQELYARYRLTPQQIVQDVQKALV